MASMANVMKTGGIRFPRAATLAYLVNGHCAVVQKLALALALVLVLVMVLIQQLGNRGSAGCSRGALYRDKLVYLRVSRGTQTCYVLRATAIVTFRMHRF